MELQHLAPAPMPAAAPPREVARRGLVQAVLDRPESLIVIDTAAGTGKSTLLRQIAARSGAILHVGADAPQQGRRVVLSDIPPGSDPAPLPEVYIHGEG